MLSRREFFACVGAEFAPTRGPKMSPKERVHAVLVGQFPDRAPYSFWHHFKDEKLPAVKHASSTLDFQRKFRLDIVKVMSDYPYPKGSGGQWYQLKEEKDPFPEQIKALELVRDGLAGQKHFLETLFNPWNVAEKLSSKEAVARLMKENPQALLDALEAIAKSEVNHAKAALEAGASGIFLAVANAQDGMMTRAEYRKFSEPFDKMVLAAAKDAPMNTLHLHGDKVYLDLFWKGWHAPIINYSVAGTKVSLVEARRQYSGILMGGLDEQRLPSSSDEEVKSMIKAAQVVSPKWICAPGCSVPDDSPGGELSRVSKVMRSGD